MGIADSSNELVLTVEKLSDKSDLTKFDCSKDDELGLNEFIHKEALQYQKNGLGVTYLFYKSDKIVGYITVAMNSLKPKLADLHINNYEKVNYPALLLGRLAVDNTERAKGIAKYLVKHCIGLTLDLAEEAGCRFIILVTKGERRIKLYKANGFEETDAPLKDGRKLMRFNLCKV